jgi:hypothetical protein
MTWIALIFALELGFLPNGDLIMYEQLDLVPVQYSVYTDLQAEIEIFDLFFIGGGVWTGAWYHGGYTFWPHRSIYSFHVGLRWKGIEAGWRHNCFHAQTPYFGFGILDYKAIWEGGFDQVYIRISGRIN